MATSAVAETLEVVTMTSTWTKLLITSLTLFAVIGFVSGSHVYEDNSGSATLSDSEFSIPEYDSHQEILTELVAPFLLIFLVIQIGLQKALVFAFADDDPRAFGQRTSEERKTIKKYTVLMALVIAGMIIPSPLFEMFNDWVAIVFGGAMYILLGAVVLAFLIFLWEAF